MHFEEHMPLMPSMLLSVPCKATTVLHECVVWVWPSINQG